MNTKNWLLPKWEPGLSINQLPINHFIENKISTLFIDVDKTLIYSRDIKIHVTVREWIINTKNHLKIHLLSNNPSKERVKRVACELGLTYTYGAGKPFRNKTKLVIKEMKLNPTNTAIIGDRIFTDILGGNLLGLYTVLIKPIGIDGLPSNNQTTQNIEKLVVKVLGVKNK